MKKLFTLTILIAFLSGCQQEKVDLIITNANVYTVDNDFSKAEAFAIKDGKFVAVGSIQLGTFNLKDGIQQLLILNKIHTGLSIVIRMKQQTESY